MVDCTAPITDLQFDIPVTVVTIKWNCECGSVLTYDCDWHATCVDDCDLEKRLEACRTCTDLFDLCCMPECEDGKFLRIKSCNNCNDKYELVDACDIWNEIVNNDKCWFEIDIQCDNLEPLFEVCSTLANPSPDILNSDGNPIEGFSIECVGGKLQLCGELPATFTCDRLRECFPEDIVTCEQTCEEILVEISDCPPCEDCEEPECDYKHLLYCPSEKKLKLEANPHRIQCYRNSRGKAALSWGLNIQMAVWEEKWFYLSPTEISATRQNIEHIWSAWVLIPGKDWLETSWVHRTRNSAIGANGCHQVCTAGDYQLSFSFQVEVNKSIHALRMWLVVVRKDWTVQLSCQDKLWGIDWFYYSKPCPEAEALLCAHWWRSCEAAYGQPNTPDIFYWSWGCNDYTSAIWGNSNPANDTQWGWRDWATFSLGRVIGARTFSWQTWEYLNPGDKVVPVIFISAAMAWDCDAANNPYQAMTSILWDWVTTWWGGTYWFTSSFEVVWINDIEENRCLLDKFGCCCGDVEWTDEASCCCGQEPTVPETVNFVEGEATYTEPPVIDTCDINWPEDCPEGTFYVENPEGCDFCTPDALPWTWGSV